MPGGLAADVWGERHASHDGAPRAKGIAWAAGKISGIIRGFCLIIETYRIGYGHDE
jgi:hypothetical protein